MKKNGLEKNKQKVKRFTRDKWLFLRSNGIYSPRITVQYKP